MANVDKLKPFILKWEGGFVDDPDDLGGATNKGITFATYCQYRKKKMLSEPTIEDLKKISDNEWTEILKTMYWDRWKADFIKNQSIANILVDFVWASGVHGIKRPQNILRVKVDGIVGDKTISALNKENPKILFEKIKKDRIKFIDEICKSRPKNEKYRKGWLNRINEFKFEP